ncbi:hypothetical protein COP2_026483 [Malus domestica]
MQCMQQVWISASRTWLQFHSFQEGKSSPAPGGSRSSLLLGCVALAWCVRHPVWIHCTIMYNLSRASYDY